MIDIEGTYPKIEEVANTAKETTVRELAGIDGLDEEIRRELGINLSGCEVNAIEICVGVLGVPNPMEWLALYDSCH